MLMVRKNIDNLLIDGCSTYAVPPGELEITRLGTNTSYNLYNFGLYFTNCSSDQIEYYMEEILDFISSQDVFGQQVDSYPNGVVAACFVLSSVTVAAWLIVTTHIFSVNRKPLTLTLVTLLYAICSTVTLTRTSHLLDDQFSGMYQDVSEFDVVILSGLPFRVTNYVVKIGIWISWLQIGYKMAGEGSAWQKQVISGYRSSRLVLLCLAILCLVNIVLTGVDYFTHYGSQDKTLYGLSIAEIVSHVLVYIPFWILVIQYTVRRFKSAYNSQSLPLVLTVATVSLATLPIFLVWKVSSSINTWALMLYDLLEILSASLIWEWIADIESGDKEMEKHAVVGREIQDHDTKTPKIRNRRQTDWNKFVYGQSNRIPEGYPISAQEIEMYSLLNSDEQTADDRSQDETVPLPSSGRDRHGAEST
ncbi:unnamed protein product [Kuraishia capsulata CBS 1993]|uniref:PH-response regulator protein palH/RIM21 n=1 Tax=Kuraishia capsulata CBS 1993 TaxID=1382522 RepID=W6MHM9_9ASCO|nr:uncharacterized protein KUCA_T00001769001 [Kuraishia capsulata CBS 1993]CDK25799.1 unnamed protein product [Kuraishia capsulata CBS 1993]